MEINWVKIPADLLTDVSTVLFFLVLAKLAKWKLAEWQNLSYKFLVVGFILADILAILYKNMMQI